MDINKQLTKNLKIVESRTLGFFSDGSPKVRFICIFFGQEYYADLSGVTIKKGWNSIEAEGDQELFDSFVDQVEDTHWDEFVALFGLHCEDEAIPYAEHMTRQGVI